MTVPLMISLAKERYTYISPQKYLVRQYVNIHMNVLCVRQYVNTNVNILCGLQVILLLTLIRIKDKEHAPIQK